MSSNNDDAILAEMLKWKINVFASVPEHIEAVTDEFQLLMQLHTSTIFTISQREYQQHGRGALLIQETLTATPGLTFIFLIKEALVNSHISKHLFAENNRYKDNICKLLLYRIQTYNPLIEVIVLWTAANKVGVALWDKLPLSFSTDLIENNSRFPF